MPFVCLASLYGVVTHRPSPKNFLQEAFDSGEISRGQAYLSVLYYRAPSPDPYVSFARDENGLTIAKATGRRALRESDGVIFKEYVLHTRKGHPVRVFRTEADAPLNDRFDCHGSSFANAECWIFNDEVERILGDGGWTEVSAREVRSGDVGIYRDKHGHVVHSVTVIGRDELGCVHVNSKEGFSPIRTNIVATAAWVRYASLLR